VVRSSDAHGSQPAAHHEFTKLIPSGFKQRRRLESPSTLKPHPSKLTFFPPKNLATTVETPPKPLGFCDLSFGFKING
jgi:hypothetical protein